MSALLAKSQFVEVKRLAAFGPRFLNESVKFGAGPLGINDFFPMPIALRELTQLIKHGASLGLA